MQVFDELGYAATGFYSLSPPYREVVIGGD
jgi:hypothetical protein